jgi:hypothetical protein
MDTKKIDETVGNHAPLVVLVGVMAITLPALFGLGHKLFANDPLRQVSLMGISELSLLLWHQAHNHAKGDKQNSIASSMVWLSVGAVVVLAGLDILLTTAESGQIAVAMDKSFLGTVVTLVIPGLIAANVIGALSYMNADPGKALARAQARADYLIEVEVVKQTESAAGVIAAEMASMRAHDYITLTRAQNRNRLMAGHAGHSVEGGGHVMNADVAAPARIVAPLNTGLSAGSSAEINYDLLAAAMMRAQRGAPVAVVESAVDAKK